ncbi:hypothetical protein RZS08_21275, partial [Arthrospira platensis SPKY1]|nr:hypothetical protein [Arthrospira platensis SPKY1]
LEQPCAALGCGGNAPGLEAGGGQHEVGPACAQVVQQQAPVERHVEDIVVTGSEVQRPLAQLEHGGDRGQVAARQDGACLIVPPGHRTAAVDRARQPLDGGERDRRGVVRHCAQAALARQAQRTATLPVVDMAAPWPVAVVGEQPEALAVGV